MNKLIKINGIKEIEGMKFHDIEGGFGEGKKAMLVKDIANIHQRELRGINQNIERNRTRFKDGIDIIDLKGTKFEITLSDNGIYNQNSINRSSNIYLLSERGYAKLLKILEDDIAWEQYEKLVDGYFNMREQAKKLSTEEILELQYRYTKEVKEEVKELKDDFNNFKGNSPLFNIECRELQALVRKTGIMHLGGYKSQAYRDNSLRSRVYADIQHQLKREFGVSRYEAIKRGQLDKAMELVNNYILPTVLIDEIRQVNNQINFKEVI
ncbi:ORF6C domain-containing protein [Clostridium septicum]|uniref:ORF6C domain-containing protein n=1 Tax=Clostridium septicum TaxID=1504 RepID=UPI00082E784F|nr:ORF6C domain-containing protein [Clostridium septicum]